MAKKLVEFSPDYAVIPGESLKEFLEFSGMSERIFIKNRAHSAVNHKNNQRRTAHNSRHSQQI